MNEARAGGGEKGKNSVRRSRQLFACAAVLALIALAFMGVAHSAAPLRPDAESLERARPALLERLRKDAYDYFRFVNRSWIARVCDAFRSDLEGLPVVRLHGDAHVEQFA
jgi:hypothetical protein